MRRLPAPFDALAARRPSAWLLWIPIVIPMTVLAEPPEQCDPAKVLSAATCAQCHASEAEVWKSTPHFRTFDTLHRTPRAKEIAAKMGVSSIKRSEVCASCHYTQQQDE